MDARDDLLLRLVGLFKALGDPVRLRLLGLLAERPRTGKELADAVAVGAPTISHHMSRLIAAGLVTLTREGQSRRYALDERALATLQRAARAAAVPELAAAPSIDVASADATERERAKVMRDFFDGERLKQIPAQRKKRVIVLQHLAHRFTADRAYPEREVNDLLRAAHDDVATLRRELINYGYLTRAGGVYRVARDLPQRSVQVNQEITGDEHAWLRSLIAETTRPSA